MATITETGTIDLKAQKEAHDEAINAAASDATTKANAAAKTATDYITPDGTSTAAFHPEASSANQVKVDGTGVDIIKGNTSVAKYGEVARIGKESESRIELDFHSMKLVDKDGRTYLHVSDLRNSDGVASISERFVVDSNTEKTSNSTKFTLAYVANSVTHVIIDDSEIESNEYNVTTASSSSLVSTLTILRVLNIGQEVSVEYTTTSNLAKAFTFGYRKPGSFTGAESHAVGSYIEASGRLSNAEGLWTVASGFNSHAEGNSAKARGDTSHAEGYLTEANGQNSHAEGNTTQANGTGSHSEGYSTTASGSYSHAEGDETTASGNYSHAEGEETTASGSSSHSEGHTTEASGINSHAEGWRTVASGAHSHAEGAQNTASGGGSHAEGIGNEASGSDAHAEGWHTVASGGDSHAQNLGTIASSEAQTAIGKYNVDNSSGSLAFIIGNGTSVNARSNAFTVDWDGNTFPSGNIELKVPTIDRDSPSSSIYDSAHSILLLDKDGEPIGIIRCLQLSDGRIGTTIAAYNENTSGSQVNNALNVMVDRNGASSYSMTDPAAFRSAIAAFSTSGGDVVGPVRSKNSVIDRKVSPSSAQYSTDIGGGSSFQLTDKNGAVLGYIRASKQVDGRTGLDLRVWNSDTAGSNAVNGAFQILIDRSGTVSYSIANQTGFRNAIGASSGIFPRSAGGTGMSARTTGTVTRSGITTAGTLNAYSNGVVCTVTGHDLALKTALASGGNVNIATLPDGYRPPTNMYGTIHAGASSRNNKGFIRITSDGVVRFSNYSDASWATNYTIAFTITWAL